MGTTILSFQNRVVIETLHKEGYSLSQIAKRIGFFKTTVHHELHRVDGPYQARQAEKLHRSQLKRRGAKITLSQPIKRSICRHHHRTS